MNDKRRVQITKITKKINDTLEQLNLIKDDIDNIKEEEEDSLNNTPESFQERYQKISDAFDILDTASTELSDCIDLIENIVTMLGDAAM